MEGLIDYLVKLSGTLMVVYVFYWLVLRRLTFYVSNRWYLLGYSIASIVIPFVNVNPLLRSAQLEDDQFVQLVPVLNTQGFDQSTSMQVSTFWDGKDAVVALFALGIVVMLIRFIIQYFSVRSVRNASLLISAGDVNVYHIDKNIVPFSFGNSIFINRHKHSENDLRDIIKHEFIHVKQKHTIDILWSELLCVLNWYNPFAWLIRNAIRQNLEFIADSKVLENGIDKKQYQYLLLKVVGVHQNGIAPSFNFTSLKKRIAMMNKMRSAKVHVIKFLFVLPLLAVILLAFRDKVTTTQAFHTEGISGAFILADHASDDLRVIDTIPAPKKPTVRDQKPRVFKPNDKGYIITIADNNGECLVVVRDTTKKIVKCLTLVEWDEKEKEYIGTYGEISGVAPKPPVPPMQPETPKAPGAPAMPDNISSMHVKDKKLTIVTKSGETEIYDLDNPGQKENFQKKYGAVPASPQNPQSAPNPANQRQVIIDRKENKPPGVASVQQGSDSILLEKIKTSKVTINTPEDFQGLIILDDKEYDKNSFETEVKLDASVIQRVEVYKNEKAVQLYGEKGKNGVIRIVTK